MNWVFVAIILLLGVSAAEIDICLPSFPAIGKQFGLSISQTEFILGSNLLFHCLGALIAGGLSNWYGKKRITTYGFIIFVIGSIICYLANHYWVLIVGRAMQGFGVAAPATLIPLMILDLYKGDQQKYMMNITNGVSTLVVSLAPTLGAMLESYGNWRTNFLCLLVTGCAAVIVNYYVMPRDAKINPNTSSMTIIDLSGYISLFCKKLNLAYFFALSFSISSYYVFVAMAPIFYMQSCGLSLKQFGVYQSILTLTFGFVSIFSGKIITIIGKRMAFQISIFLIGSYMLLSFVGLVLNILNAEFVLLFMILLSAGVAMPVNALYVNGLNASKEHSGQMAAALIIGKWLFCTIGFQIAAHLYCDNIRSISAVMLTLQVSSILLCFYIAKHDKNFIPNMV